MPPLLLRTMSPTSNRPTAATLILSARSVRFGMFFDFRRLIKIHHTPLEGGNVPSATDFRSLDWAKALGQYGGFSSQGQD
jgi:hypothetical protein